MDIKEYFDGKKKKTSRRNKKPLCTGEERLHIAKRLQGAGLDVPYARVRIRIIVYRKNKLDRTSVYHHPYIDAFVRCGILQDDRERDIESINVETKTVKTYPEEKVIFEIEET